MTTAQAIDRLALLRKLIRPLEALPPSERLSIIAALSELLGSEGASG